MRLGSVAAVLGILLAAPACAEWQRLAETDSGTTTYVDPATLRETGNSQTVKTLQDLKGRGSSGELSRIMLEEYDCGGLKNRTASITLYDDRMGRGRVILSFSTHEPWKDRSREWIRNYSAGVACADASAAQPPAPVATPGSPDYLPPRRTTSSGALGQVLQLTSTYASGAGMDSVIKAFGTALGSSLGKEVEIKNRPGENGARAVREFEAARPDGTELLFLNAAQGQPDLEVGNLVPIAKVAGPSSTWRWLGVFAPPGTPAPIARGLEAATIAALNSRGFRSGLMFTPVPGDGAELVRLVAVSQAGSARPVAQAPAARPQAPTAARYAWPAGVEPGNMYLVEYTLPEQGPTVYPMMVSAKSSQDALSTVTRAWDEHYESMGVPPGNRRTAAVFRVGAECVGPGWAATAEYSEYEARKPVWGAVCGYETPGEAIKEAARRCTQKGSNSCDNPVPKKSEVVYTVAHSGARGWNPVFASMPSYRITFAAFGATTSGIGGYSQVGGTSDALEKMDKACESGYGKRPCFIASTKWSCVSQTSLQDLSPCIETRLTPAGFK